MIGPTKDAFGETSIRRADGTELTGADLAKFISLNPIVGENPFRWKSHYWDQIGNANNPTNGYYMINTDGGTRYYDPTNCSYISAETPENLLTDVGQVHGLNRYGITVDNCVALMAALYTIYTTIALSYDDSYVHSRHISWWERNWHWLRWVALGLSIILTIVTLGKKSWTLALVAGAIIAGAAITGFIIGGLVGGGGAGGFCWSSAIEGAYWGAMIAVALIAIFKVGMAVGAKIHKKVITAKKAKMAKAKAVQKAAIQCFIEGTLVLCRGEDGKKCHKSIEDIKEGDLVWAYDEESGKCDWKPVVQLFRNGIRIKDPQEGERGIGKGMRDWIGITVCGKEIVSTPGHKYLLPENTEKRNLYENHEHIEYEDLSEKWVSAQDVKVGDKVLLSDGKCAIVEKVRRIRYNKSQITYNFEVEGFHTYFFGEQGICTHNAGGPCTTDLFRVMSNAEFGSLTKYKKFKTVKGAMHDKWFTTSFDDAVTWAKNYYPDGGFKIVKVTVPTSSLKKMHAVAAIDGIGQSYAAHYKLLNEIMLGFWRVL